jgi:hypothetical protein
VRKSKRAFVSENYLWVKESGGRPQRAARTEVNEEERWAATKLVCGFSVAPAFFPAKNAGGHREPPVQTVQRFGVHQAANIGRQA